MQVCARQVRTDAKRSISEAEIEQFWFKTKEKTEKRHRIKQVLLHGKNTEDLQCTMGLTTTVKGK